MIKQIIQMLKTKIGDSTYYGVLSVSFEGGRVTLVTEKRTYKLSDE
jgi:hypothetical protein